MCTTFLNLQQSRYVINIFLILRTSSLFSLFLHFRSSAKNVEVKYKSLEQNGYGKKCKETSVLSYSSVYSELRVNSRIKYFDLVPCWGDPSYLRKHISIRKKNCSMYYIHMNFI